MATKARSRTKKRLLEIKDHLKNLGTVEYAQRRLREQPLLGDASSQELVCKMLSLELIDDYTSFEVFDFLVDKLPAMRLEVSRCVRGNGLDLLSSVLQQQEKQDSSGNGQQGHVSQDPQERSIPRTFELGRTNYTTAIKRPEDKCIFWTMADAFFLLYFEHVTGSVFLLPTPLSNRDLDNFFDVYPEFAVRTWDANDLLQFRLVMRHIVDMYGNGNNKACLVEMVTRITRGRAIALTCNTSGGAMKKETIYNDETEVAAECCRVRIYQRESGIEPRRRDHTHPNDAMDPNSDLNGMANYSMPMPPMTAADLKRVPTADIRMIVGLKDAFQHDSMPHSDVDGAGVLALPAAKRQKTHPGGHKSSPPKINSSFGIGMPKPGLDRRHSSGQSDNSGIDSILAAAGIEEMFDVHHETVRGKPDMSRTISQDISYSQGSMMAPESTSSLLHLGGQETAPNYDGDDHLKSLLYNKPVLTRKRSTQSNSSVGSCSSYSLSRTSSTGNSSGTTPGRVGPPKACRVTSTDWAQYPYNQLK
jgi:hypothetical protein